MTKPDIDILVLGAGKGSRMGAERNKMFLTLEGVPIFFATLHRLSRIPRIRRIFPVLREGEEIEFEKMIEQWGPIKKLQKPVIGGAERHDSVRNGLQAILDEEDPAKLIMVHDGARPLVSRQLIERLTEAVIDQGVAIPALPIFETVRRQKADSTEWVDRANLFTVQTPQAFQFHQIEPVFLTPQPLATIPTDEASQFEHRGQPVVMVEGDPWNLKITTPTDLAWAKLLMTHFKNELDGE